MLPEPTSGVLFRDLRRHFGDRVFRTIVPRNVRLAEAPSHGLPALQYDSRSLGLILLSQLKSSTELLTSLAAEIDGSELPSGNSIAPFFASIEWRTLNRSEHREPVRVLVEGSETDGHPVVYIAVPVETDASKAGRYLVGRELFRQIGLQHVDLIAFDRREIFATALPWDQGKSFSPSTVPV